MTRCQVETTGGIAGGAEGGGARAFKGIPYAADTSGARRFRPPRPRRPWPGVRDCVEYGPSCPQMTVEQMLGVPVLPESETFLGTWNYERVTGEDCLALNVWRPAADATAPRPVLVWLHGGGWSTGSASWPLYDFANLARKGDLVVVSVNHRVGILGFLDLSDLGDEFADSGNVGMLDIVAALEWIRDNIAAFGGDPGNVTIFGESGGGAKVSALLAMPAAQGLFHKASAMSGSMLASQPADVTAANTAAILDHLGLGASVDKLAAVDAARLVDAEVALPRAHALALGRGLGPVPGPSLPRHPADAIRAGLGRDVTLLSGCNSDETLGFLFSDPGLWNLTTEAALGKLRPLLGDDAEPVLAAYGSARPDDSPTSLLIAISTDAMFRVPQIRLAEAHAAGGGKATYMYLYTWGLADPTGRPRAAHGTDMPYFFANVDKAPIAAGPHADALAAAMSGTLVALAHTGSPGHEALPGWPRYEPDRRATMRFEVPATVEDDPLGAERECWNGINLTGLCGG